MSPREIASANQSPERPSFGDGLRALFGGFGFVLSNPGVWPLAMVPVVVAVTLLVIFGWVAVDVVPPRIEALFGATSGAAMGVVAWLAKVFAVILALLAAALVSFGLAQPLSGPALERIVRRAEAKLGVAPWPPTSFLADILRSLQTVLVGYVFGLPALALLFLVGALFPPAVVVTFPLKMVVMAMLITWDLCDYPLSIRGLRVGDRVGLLGRHIRAVFGFGVGLSFLSLLPCALLLVLPAGVAGAARLVASMERWEASQRERGRGIAG